VSFVEELYAAGRRFIVSPILYAVHTHAHPTRASAEQTDQEFQVATSPSTSASASASASPGATSALVPCRFQSGAHFDRLLIGGSCAASFYAHLQQRYHYRPPRGYLSWVAKLNAAAHQCYGGCVTDVFPNLKKQPPARIVVQARLKDATR
jgi:hypothetical protein